MKLHHIAAFSDKDQGGNPAGVAILNEPLNEQEMSNIAATLGYSETAFAYPLSNNNDYWRVRYFSPESEVPFCGHATVALGAVLAETFGLASYALQINQAEIELTAHQKNNVLAVTIKSPPTHSRELTQKELRDSMALFSLHEADLHPLLAPAFMNAGANHILLPLRSRETLASMAYPLEEGRQLMSEYGLVTVMLVYPENEQIFHARNAFASGGVLEDPATGAAAAAFAGYLRDQKWPHGGEITLYQGQDMGIPCVISVSLSNESQSPVMLTGSIRKIM